VVADIAKLSVGREEYYTGSWPPTTSSICLATASPQAGGTAPAPAPLAAGRSIGGRVPADVRGPPSQHRRTPRPRLWQGCGARVRRGTAPHQERLGPLWAGRPGDRPDGSGGPPRRCPGGGRLSRRAPGRPPRTWRCPARVRTGAAGGRLGPPDISRGGSAAAHPPGGGQPRPRAGRTVDGVGRSGPVPASAGRRRHLPGHLPAGAVPVARSGVDGGGRSRQPRAGRDARGVGPQLLQAQRPDRRRARPAGRRRAGADATAGQVGRAGHSQAQAARGAGHPVWTVAAGGGRARTGLGHPGPDGDRPDSQPRPGPDGVHGGGQSAVRSAGRTGRADRDRVHLRPPGRHRRHRRAPRRSHPGRARGVGRPVLCREDRGRGGGSGTGGAPLVHPRTAGRGAAAGRRRHRPGRRADRRCWP
jgi:hypothetical protein